MSINERLGLSMVFIRDDARLKRFEDLGKAGEPFELLEPIGGKWLVEQIITSHDASGYPSDIVKIVLLPVIEVKR